MIVRKQDITTYVIEHLCEDDLRAIVKMLDDLTEEEISKVNIPTAMPLLYELDENFRPITPRGVYLDPEAAAAGAAAVAAQGQK